ncbi:MAG: hypothetical protein Salg2KO_02040 [Salibacteraceae bacterium]
MKRKAIFIACLSCLIAIGCKRNDEFPDPEVEIPEFNFEKTVSFEENLSAYEIFAGNPANLIPSSDFQLLELSSVLFTDYSHKQRLVKIPSGTQMTKRDDGTISFPNGTVLTKTFFYYHDDRDTSLGKQIIETRLLVKESDQWNVATYLWNESQTEATLTLTGHDTAVKWVGQNGASRSTVYHVPSENECMTCHQSNASMTPLGPTLMRLNRTVERDGEFSNQLSHLQMVGLMEEFSVSEISKMVDYKDPNASIEERGRAYLALNCSHCHNPNAWDVPADRDFDFRYNIPFAATGILYGKDKILRTVMDEEMPFIGTTMPDDEGVALLVEYIESLD